MSTQVTDTEFDPDDPTLTRFDLVREGARRDGVEIVHYEQRLEPGSKAEKIVERRLIGLFLLAGLAATVFVVAYIWWPWEYEHGNGMDKWYTPILGASLGLALFAIGAAIVIWGKWLVPAEVAVQERHDDINEVEAKLTGANIMNQVDELNIARRPLLKGAIAMSALPLGAAAIVPLGALLVDPNKGEPLFHTGFDGERFNNGQPVRLVRKDGSPIRPEEVASGGQITAFPGIPHGSTNQFASAPALLIHLRESDAEEARNNLSNIPLNEGGMWENYVAYSKICTHLGCPASLYEQRTNRLLCPCHQSQFQVTDNARPIFGPATRRLPMLPLGVDEEGFFYATSDYKVPVGAGFWERP